MTIIHVYILHGVLMYGWSGGPVIAVAVFIAGPRRYGTAKSASLRHFLRGPVTQSFGLQFGGAMGLGCRCTLINIRIRIRAWKYIDLQMNDTNTNKVNWNPSRSEENIVNWILIFYAFK